jgi:OOP family OmpA-OmpF porin
VPAPAAPAASVGLVGLPLMGSQIDVIGTVEFDTNQATIRQTPQTIGLLTMVVQAGKTYPMINKLRIEGHTDDDGDANANQLLSERRAQAVAKYLIDHGIEANRLHPVGCGSRDPLMPNNSAENKARNRRTEFDIEEVGGRPIDGATAACAPNPLRKK